MCPRRILILLSIVLSSSLTIIAQRNQPTREQERARQQEESGNYLKKWPQEEVAYIITDDERAAFNALKTDLEREQFIEMFWRRRDRTPDTIDNEYRDDYFLRIAKANELFSSGVPGWKTDRGRIYVVFGEPDQRETNPMGGTYHRPPEEGGGVTNTFPWEKWRYRHLDNIGENIELEFVDSSMSGEYRLTFDRSEKDALLNVPGAGLTEREALLGLDKSDRLNRNNAALGNALSTDTRSPFDAIMLESDLYRPPAVKYKDLEPLVNVRMSFNVLPFDVRADFLKISEVSVQVPITIQIPYKYLSFKAEPNGVQRAVGRVSGTITDLTGGVKERIEDPIDLPLLASQLSPDGVATYQRIVNLPPRRAYRLFLLVEDSRTGNKGTSDVRLEVKSFPEDNLSASSLILADVIEALPSRAVNVQYQIGSLKVRPNVKNSFRRDQPMNVFLQVYGLQVDEKTHKPSVTSEILITRDGKLVKKIVDDHSELANAARQMNVIERISLQDLDPGEYNIEVTVKDNLANDRYVAPSKFTVR